MNLIMGLAFNLMSPVSVLHVTVTTDLVTSVNERTTVSDLVMKEGLSPCRGSAATESPGRRASESLSPESRRDSVSGNFRVGGGPGPGRLRLTVALAA
eukprot:763082-Hanusia_phi.AAC.3